ncbi:MAG: cytochrome d ubiquinol oxidase subunit II [Trebonia sp.]
MPIASLNTTWFALIGLLWAGYFVLEGFDFGVGILVPIVGRNDFERRLCINTIGPTWDANEVWLIVAAGATFASFPTWYAVMFSGFYLPMFAVLVGLIVRGVSFEFRGKDRAPAWRAAWDRALWAGSVIPAFLWGVIFTDLVSGLAIGGGPRYSGGLGGVLHPVALFGGLVTLALFCLHGAVFLSAKTTGELNIRARRVVRVLAGPAMALVAGLVVWVGLTVPKPGPGTLGPAVPLTLAAVAVAAIGIAWAASARRRDASAFAAVATAVLSLAAATFSALFPRVMVSTVPGGSLTIWNAASEHNTLVVMTVVAAVFTPFVLGYQAWSYWVFRQRLGRQPQGPPDEASRDVPSGPGGGSTDRDKVSLVAGEVSSAPVGNAPGAEGSP